MLITALIFGLLGSFHCVGMCGPIAFMLPVSRDNEVKKFFQILFYHAGRLVSYTCIGLAFGIVGKSLNLLGFQQQLSILIGVLMISVILIPKISFQKYNPSIPLLKIIGNIKFSLGAALKKKTPDTFFTIGFLNGFLPCGLVYMAALGAITTGSIGEGGFYMLWFGFGTIPLMTTAVYFGILLKGIKRQRILKLIPVSVVFIGLLFILRGLGLGIPYVSPQQAKEKVTSTMVCH